MNSSPGSGTIIDIPCSLLLESFICALLISCGCSCWAQEAAFSWVRSQGPASSLLSTFQLGVALQGSPQGDFPSRTWRCCWGPRQRPSACNRVLEYLSCDPHHIQCGIGSHFSYTPQTSYFRQELSYFDGKGTQECQSMRTLCSGILLSRLACIWGQSWVEGKVSGHCGDAKQGVGRDHCPSPHAPFSIKLDLFLNVNIVH